LQVAARGWDALTPELARLLLLSPLGGATPTVLRALGRRLRALARAAGDDTPPPSSVLLRDAVVEPGDLSTLEDWAADPARQLSRVLGEARRLVVAGGVYVNNRRVADHQARISVESAIGGRVLVLRKGAKQNHLVRILQDDVKNF